MSQAQNTLVNAIKAKMKALGLNQTSLSESSGVTQPVISRLLNGSINIKIDNLDAILKALGLLITAKDCITMHPVPSSPIFETEDDRLSAFGKQAVDTVKDVFLCGDPAVIVKLMEAISEAKEAIASKKAVSMDTVTSPVVHIGHMEKKAA
jgi:predicted transcriptional regulator